MKLFQFFNFGLLICLITGTILFKISHDKKFQNEPDYPDTNDLNVFNTENSDNQNYFILNENKKMYFDPNDERNFDKLMVINNIPSMEAESFPKGIYVDLIYNPNFNSELKIVQYILIEILNKTKINFFYDFENLSNSTVITTGFEEGYVLSKRHLITIKPKLLKDIMYNENIFSRIYNLIYNYFRIGQRYEIIPEYDRTINYKRYKETYKHILKKLDHVNFNNIICRTELINKFKKKICIRVYNNYIDNIFRSNNTAEFYKSNLEKIVWFVSRILDLTTDLKVVEQNSNEDCYEIKVYPETDITKVLLFPHAAVITADPNEKINVVAQNYYNKIMLLIITLKHRILHSLGLIHKYSIPSVMANYENEFQKNNLFFLLIEDYEALNQCYGSYNNYPYYVKNYSAFNETLFYLFVSNFTRFREEYNLFHY